MTIVINSQYTIPPILSERFEQRLKLLLSACQDVIDQAYKMHSISPILKIETGKRYIRIVKHGDISDQIDRAYGFVNIDTGDVHSAKSFKYPAVCKAGNIYNEDFGASHATADHIR